MVGVYSKHLLGHRIHHHLPRLLQLRWIEFELWVVVDHGLKLEVVLQSFKAVIDHQREISFLEGGLLSLLFQHSSQIFY